MRASAVSNTSRSNTPGVWPKPGSILRSAASATATTTRWPKRSTASTRPRRSSKARCQGGKSDRKEDPAKVWGALTACRVVLQPGPGGLAGDAGQQSVAAPEPGRARAWNSDCRRRAQRHGDAEKRGQPLLRFPERWRPDGFFGGQSGKATAATGAESAIAGSLSLDGEVASGMVGLDWSRDPGSRLGGRDRPGSGANE